MKAQFQVQLQMICVTSGKSSYLWDWILGDCLLYSQPPVKKTVLILCSSASLEIQIHESHCNNQTWTLLPAPQGPHRKWALRNPTGVQWEVMWSCFKRLIYSLRYPFKNVWMTSLTSASRMAALVPWIPNLWVYCWDPRMGYAIERQSNTTSAPVTYLLEQDMHNGAQDVWSPHICVPSHPLPLSCLRGVSADREAEGKRWGFGDERGAAHLCVWKSGKWHLRVQSGGISLYYVQWWFLHHYNNNLS